MAWDVPTEAVPEQPKAGQPWTCELGEPSTSAHIPESARLRPAHVLPHDAEVSWALLTQQRCGKRQLTQGLYKGAHVHLPPASIRMAMVAALMLIINYKAGQAPF